MVGATLQLYDHGAATAAKRGACCAGQDIHDARRVADRLGIPHYVLDREERFRDAVVRDFADAYARGETPIPCVRCNQTVKFRDLVALASRPRLRGAGHRPLRAARRGAGRAGAAPRRRSGAGPELLPVRHHAGPARLLALPARRLSGQGGGAGARRRGSACRVAEKPDSQDICFVPSGRYHEVVARFRPDAAEAGEIAHLDGRVLGRHAGVARYTVGQGRGLGVASRDSGGEPLYVAALDAERRRVVVGPRGALPRAEIVVGEVNWLCPPPDGAFACEVKLRAREAPQPATAAWDADARLLRVRPNRSRHRRAGPGLRALRRRPGAGRRLHPAPRRGVVLRRLTLREQRPNSGPSRFGGVAQPVRARHS